MQFVFQKGQPISDEGEIFPLTKGGFDGHYFFADGGQLRAGLGCDGAGRRKGRVD
jgi:hypothetical protein